MSPQSDKSPTTKEVLTILQSSLALTPLFPTMASFRTLHCTPLLFFLGYFVWTFGLFASLCDALILRQKAFQVVVRYRGDPYISDDDIRTAAGKLKPAFNGIQNADPSKDPYNRRISNVTVYKIAARTAWRRNRRRLRADNSTDEYGDDEYIVVTETKYFNGTDIINTTITTNSTDNHSLAKNHRKLYSVVKAVYTAYLRVDGSCNSGCTSGTLLVNAASGRRRLSTNDPNLPTTLKVKNRQNRIVAKAELDTADAVGEVSD